MFRRNYCNIRPMECCDIEMAEQIIEPTVTKCIEKNIMHEVPHVCPMHTHVINRHIYNHTYAPQFTCSEETQIVNNDCGKCQGMM